MCRVYRPLEIEQVRTPTQTPKPQGSPPQHHGFFYFRLQLLSCRPQKSLCVAGLKVVLYTSSGADAHCVLRMRIAAKKNCFCGLPGGVFNNRAEAPTKCKDICRPHVEVLQSVEVTPLAAHAGHAASPLRRSAVLTFGSFGLDACDSAVKLIAGYT